MSGSGGGGFGGGSYGEPVACDRLIIDTAVSSPKEPVIKRLNVGDFLSVVLEEQFGTTVVALYLDRDKAGGITSASTNRLRECIQAGTTYFATVTSITDGQVQVRIKPVKR